MSCLCLIARAVTGARRLWMVSMLAAAVMLQTPAAHAAPPDGRAYELVSPADKSKGSVAFVNGGVMTQALNGVSVDGSRAMFFSYAVFPGSPHGLQSSYRAERSPQGWTSENWTPVPKAPEPSLYNSAFIVDATDDLQKAFGSTQDSLGPLDQDSYFPGGTFGAADIFSRDGMAPAEWISRNDQGAPDAVIADARYGGHSADGRQVFFMSSSAITADTPAAVGANRVYVRDAAGARLLDKDVNGAPLSQCGASVGDSSYVGLTGQNAVSPDGGRVVLQTPDGGGILFSGDPSCSELSRIFVDDHEVLKEASASQKSVPDPPATSAVYEGASHDGSLVVFRSGDQLTDDATPGGGVYRYDVVSGDLTFLSTGATDPAGAELVAVVKVADNGNRVFFIAQSVLDPGKGVDGSDNLYVADGSSVRFIATLDPGDRGLLTGLEQPRMARTTAAGNRFVFGSRAALTGTPTGGFVTLYLWDADAPSSLQCASCRPNGSPPTGDAEFVYSSGGGVNSPVMLSRNLTVNGEAVFFDTPTPLSDADDNGAADVYEYRDGRLRMISTGTSETGAYFFSASADGRDVFFATSETLVPQDVDNGDNDIYDARVGGGFPVPEAPSPCRDDGCQPTPASPPAPPVAGSSSVFAPVPAAPLRAKAHKLKVAAISAAARASFARTGRLTLRVTTMAAGTVTVKARGSIGSKAVTVASSSKRKVGAGQLSLSLTLSSAARRELASKRRLAVAITVTASGAEPRRVAVTLTKTGRR
jgi:hypothetical protein